MFKHNGSDLILLLDTRKYYDAENSRI